MLIKKVIPNLLKKAAFRRYWTGKTISLLGDQIKLLVFPLTAVLTLHASVSAMGLLTAVMWLPYLLFGVHAGAWVDQFGRRRQIMIVADIARAILILCVPITYFLGILNIPILVGVEFLVGIFTVFFNVSSSTLFVSLVREEEYVEANSLLNGSRAVSFHVGPSLGGLLVQIISAPVTLVLDALSFVASAVFLIRINPKEAPPVKREKGHTSAGLYYIWNNPILRYSLASVATMNLFNYIFTALFVFYATRTLHVAPAILGLILGAGAFGTVLGSISVVRISKKIGLGLTLLLGVFLFPAPLILIPIAGGPHVLVITYLFFAELISGFGLMVLDISCGTILAATIPDRLRARVNGGWGFINNGIRPVGALLGGALPSIIGIHGALWIGAVGGCLGVLWLLPSSIIRLREAKDFRPQEEVKTMIVN